MQADSNFVAPTFGLDHIMLDLGWVTVEFQGSGYLQWHNRIVTRQTTTETMTFCTSCFMVMRRSRRKKMLEEIALLLFLATATEEDHCTSL